MNKKIILSGIAISCTLFFAGCKKSEPVATDTSAETTPLATTDPKTAADMAKWAETIQSGGALKCSYSNATEGQTATYEVKGKKLHIVNETSGENKVVARVISDGEMMYTWEDGKKEGFKMKLPSEEELQKSEGLAEQTKKNFPDFSQPEQIENLKSDGSTVECSPATVNDSAFVPPKDVVFQDFSAMMDNMIKNAQENMTEDQKKALEEQMKKDGN